MEHIQWIVCVLLTHCIILSHGISTNEFETCKPLIPSQNVEMICQHSTSTFGTKSIVCEYKCKNYYTQFGNPEQSNSNEVRCDLKVGNWTNLHKFHSFSCVEDCGKRMETPKPLIIHGNITDPSSWPWHATLFLKAPDSSWVYICGGSLIRNSVILTAAHCVTRRNGELQNVDQLKVVLRTISGNFSVNQQFEHAQIFEVRKIYVYMKYEPTTFKADLALIHLSGDVLFNDHVIPICLPNDYALDLNAVKPGISGDVVGFGVDETGTTSEKLKHAQFRYVSDSECFGGLKRWPTESQFCAGDNGTDGWTTICNGDSGGGFVVPSPVEKKYFIHGIISSGNKDERGGACKNYAIFTRVFQFILWIRDNLEQISGEVIRELAAGRNLQHVQRGTETTSAVFSGIPREYENLVTTIELVHSKIDPDVLFKFLEVNKGLQSLNLTHVKFTSELKSEHRVVLQHLKTFTLYVPYILRDLYQSDLTKSQLKSLLFFDKEYQSDWPLQKITHLNVNVELTVGSAKLITVDHESGRITWQEQYCSEIIQNLPPNFQLRHLSLRKCYFNISRILEDRRLDNLESLVLNEFTLTGGGWSDLLGGMRRLEELRVTVAPDWDYSDETNIHLTSLPRSLRHLYLDGADIKLFDSVAHANIDSVYFDMLPNLELFFCHYCSMDSNVIENFVNIFRNVRKFIFFGSHPVNITDMIKNMNQLETIILYYMNGEGFVGLERIPLEFPEQKIGSGNRQYIVKKKNGRWVKSYYNTNQNLTHYIHSGFDNFWTSYEEFYAGSYLRSFEKTAYNSGEYIFDGGNELERFPIIPYGVSYNLNSIHILNAEVVPIDLLDSLSYADNLEFLILDRIRLNGVFDRTKELPHLKLFRLNTLQDLNYNLQVEKEDVLNVFIPFGRSYDIPEERLTDSCGGQSRSIVTSDECDSTTEVRRFDYIPRPTSKQEHGTMEYFEVRHDNCISIIVDYKEKSFIYAMEFEDDKGLSLLNETNMKYLSLNLDEREWGLLSIPVKVEYLNLRTHVYDHPNISHVLRNLLRPLNSLKEIRIVLRGIEEGTEDQRSKINLLNLEKSSRHLELLSFEEVHVECTPTIRFENVETVFFDSCSFDQTVLDDFFDGIFPAVKYVAVGSTDHNDSAVVAEANGRLILEALKHGRINRVLGGWIRLNQNGRILGEIRKILKGVHVHSYGVTSFFVERRNGKWVSVLHEGNHSAMAMEIQRLRGDLEFGSISCNPYG